LDVKDFTAEIAEFAEVVYEYFTSANSALSAVDA